MPAAYILINLNMSVDFADSLKQIRAIEGVGRADLIVGPDDCIAYVTADDTTQLMNTIKTIRTVEGVDKTDTRSIADI
jgi:nitrate reductase NapAB chaperone NapD